MLAQALPDAFTLDDGHDAVAASNRVSRYGAYLRLERRRFLDVDNLPTTDPGEFAAAAWTVAQSPIMSPGYLRAHPRVLASLAVFDCEHRLAVAVDLAVPAPAVAQRLPARWREWIVNPRTGTVRDPNRHDQIAVLTRMTVRIPIPIDVLPAPRYRDRSPDAATAKAAVGAIANTLCGELAGVLAALEGVGR